MLTGVRRMGFDWISWNRLGHGYMGFLSTLTQYQLVPIQLVPKSTRTQRDSKEINKPKNVNHSKK